MRGDAAPAAASGLMSPSKFVQDCLVAVPRGVLPSKAVDVQKAFARATGMDRKLAAQELAGLGFASKAVAAEGSTVWAYAKGGSAYKLVEGRSLIHIRRCRRYYAYRCRRFAYPFR